MPNPTKPIYVIQATLPALEEFTAYLQQVWDNKRHTMADFFSSAVRIEVLRDYLGVKYLALFTNGTLILVFSFGPNIL